MDLPDLLQEGVVLHNGGVRDFVDLIMYARLVPGGAAVTVGDLAVEELFDLTGLLDKQLKRVRNRARLRRRSTHAQQSRREHKAQQQRQHSFFHKVPPSWIRHFKKHVYRASIQDAPRHCNNPKAFTGKKTCKILAQICGFVTNPSVFASHPLHTLPGVCYIFNREIFPLYTGTLP